MVGDCICCMDENRDLQAEVDQLRRRLDDVENEQQRTKSLIEQFQEGAISRRTFLAAVGGAAGVTALASNARAAPSWGSASGQLGTQSDPLNKVISQDVRAQTAELEQINNTRSVSTRDGLNSAIGTYPHIQLDSDITINSAIRKDIGTADAKIDLNGHTITKGSVSNPVLDITTTGDVVFKNGKYVGAGGGSQANLAELQFKGGVGNANTCRIRDVDINDYRDFAVYIEEFETAFVTEYEVTRDISESIGGADGLHIRDSLEVVVNGFDIESGDDSISVQCMNRSIERVSIGNGNVLGGANGIHVFVDPDAGDYTVGRVDISAATIETRAPDGNDAVLVFNRKDSVTRFESVHIDASISGTHQRGINVTNAASVKVEGAINNPANDGVRVHECDSGSVDVDVDGDGSGSGSKGVLISSSPNVSVKGSARGMSGSGFAATGSATTDCNFNVVSVNNGNWGYSDENSADGNLVEGIFSGNATGSRNTNTNTVVGDVN